MSDGADGAPLTRRGSDGILSYRPNRVDVRRQQSGGMMNVRRGRRGLASAVAATMVLAVLSGGALIGAGTAQAAAKCSTPVKIGVSYAGDGAATGKAIGADLADTPLPQALEKGFNLAATYFNGKGGIGGCQIQPVYYSWKYL